MEIIANSKEVHNDIIVFNTIIDEHVIDILITIFGKDKSIAIISEGKKFGNNFHIIKPYKHLICDLDFHLDKGLVMKAYDFNSSEIKSIEKIRGFIKNAGLTKYELDINNILSNSYEKCKIKIIDANDYIIEKIKP